jgi:hypothetical protein
MLFRRFLGFCGVPKFCGKLPKNTGTNSFAGIKGEDTPGPRPRRRRPWAGVRRTGARRRHTWLWVRRILARQRRRRVQVGRTPARRCCLGALVRRPSAGRRRLFTDERHTWTRSGRIRVQVGRTGVRRRRLRSPVIPAASPSHPRAQIFYCQRPTNPLRWTDNTTNSKGRDSYAHSRG